MTVRQRVVIVGGGQAGLATSRELSQRNIEHMVLERGRVGQTWRDRWDSFCLVTPNWTVQLPGQGYDGDDPGGFMARDDIVAFLDRFATSSGAPLREGVEVTAIEPADGGGFILRTPEADIGADVVVVAAGAFPRPHRPPAIKDIPPGLMTLDVEGYTNPGALPDGAVLVVGSGQTGCQIAEELRNAGREVALACGKTGWVPRRAGDRDIFEWLVATPFFEQPLGALPSPVARLAGNPQASGHGGGHDVHYRTLQALGVQLVGRLQHVDERAARFAPDLADSVAFGDARYLDVRNMIRDYCDSEGIEPPEMPDPSPFDASGPDSVELRDLGAMVVTTGYRPDYSRWVGFPAFDDLGFPIVDDGASSVVPGLYFMGVHFLRKRKSSLLMGVAEDAAVVADKIAAQLVAG